MIQNQPLLITGTDTEVGKTVLTSAIAAYWQKHRPQQRLGIFKPIQTGEGDRELYHALFPTGQSLEEITPLHFQTPVAPPVAAEIEGRAIDLGLAWQQFQALQQQRDWVLVEALGGLGSPVTWELTVADLARDWGLPAVLVVPVKLGAISQAVANVALARQSGVSLRGIVLNCIRPTTDEEIANLAPAEAIEALTQTRVLGYLPHFDDATDLDRLIAAASHLDLEYLF
ncbi:MAG TPA: ATP-dependent dethiobiotin synthetase BioD [Oscillatoriales cyanobacterium M59_W2019_021]|nr:ATP-dependent dethiobiotin synthetase BioD [Oscillatoriales cyanobacterium M4454_W2019_049]HIK49911.1 ATP-dependent dethiobiotin synthetase BioD [Oscillatoriales cyanobacterium M59_W2019_021]